MADCMEVTLRLAFKDSPEIVPGVVKVALRHCWADLFQKV